MRILVVDDDYISRSKLKSLLAQRGDCDIAPNGKMALEMFETAHAESVFYNLVTIDIEMPDIKGQELVRLIRAWEKEHKIDSAQAAKILMITVKKDIKDVSSSYYEGCEGYCTKPVTPESLNKALLDLGLSK